MCLLLAHHMVQLLFRQSACKCTMSNLFQSLVCDVTLRESRPDPSQSSENGGYYCAGGNGSWCRGGTYTPFDPNSSTHTYSMGPGGACGILTFCDASSTGDCSDTNSLQCATCKGQQQALTEIIPLLAQVAIVFSQTDYSYREFFYNSYTLQPNRDYSWMNGYCEGQNPAIPKSQCCNPQPRDPINNKCQTTLGQNGRSPFPNPMADNSQGPTDSAVTSAYWPYSMKPQLGGGNFIDTSVAEYTDMITGALTSYIQAQGEKGNVSSELSAAQESGWLYAGAYYYVISQMNKNMEQTSVPTFSMGPVNINEEPLKSYRNNYTAAGVLLTAANDQSGALVDNPAISGVGNAMTSAMSSVSDAFGKNLSGGSEGSSASGSMSSSGGSTAASNPLSQLTITGTTFLITVGILFLVMLGVTFGIGIAGNISVFVLGTGAENPVGPALILVYFILIPMIFGLMGIMLTLGATLGIYVPLIPYVIFTFGVIGWFIQVIEAMVAGPLVALGIMSPSGQHELLGKAEPALMLIFDIFLRPSLMVFGLMAAMLLAVVVVKMINAMFWSTVIQGIGEGLGKGGYVAIYANPLELILFLSAYISLIVAALNKCFAAIYIVPQGVMKWIGGGQGAAYGGEAEAMGGVEKGVSGAASGTKGGLEAGGGEKGMGAKAGIAKKGGLKEKDLKGYVVTKKAEDDKGEEPGK